MMYRVYLENGDQNIIEADRFLKNSETLTFYNEDGTIVSSFPNNTVLRIQQVKQGFG